MLQNLTNVGSLVTYLRGYTPFPHLTTPTPKRDTLVQTHTVKFTVPILAVILMVTLTRILNPGRGGSDRAGTRI